MLYQSPEKSLELGFSTCSLGMSPSTEPPRKPCRIASTSRNQKQNHTVQPKSQQKTSSSHIFPKPTQVKQVHHTPQLFPRFSPNPPEPPPGGTSTRPPPPVFCCPPPAGPWRRRMCSLWITFCCSSRSFLALGDREGWKKTRVAKNGRGMPKKKDG